MKSLKAGIGYNERLFSGGIRKFFHAARFKWVAEELSNLPCSYQAIIELGCFDGKLIDFLPLKPRRYVGFDANHEGGLDKAKEKWASYQNYSFYYALTPDDITLGENEIFDIAVIMDTLEHLPQKHVEGYLNTIAQHLNGYLFVTAPNEKGIFFLTKWLVKKTFSKDAKDYTLAEVVNATLGRMHLVGRDQHKGFDYAALIKDIEKEFEVIKVKGHPMRFLPTPLCFSIGIVARTKMG